jgi:hypothetical protein
MFHGARNIWLYQRKSEGNVWALDPMHASDTTCAHPMQAGVFFLFVYLWIGSLPLCFLWNLLLRSEQFACICSSVLRNCSFSIASKLYSYAVYLSLVFYPFAPNAALVCRLEEK